MPSRRRTLQTIGAAAGGLAAASGTVYAAGEYADDKRAPPAEGEPDVPEAAVRIAHFAPDAPAVDVLLDGEQILSELNYGEITPYLEVAPGSYQVTITAAGDPGTVVFDDAVTIEPAFQTIAAIGELGAGTFRPEILIDAGSALVRLFHASPDAPAVDVLADGEPLFQNIAFEESTNYLAVPAGSYSLAVTPAGDPETVVVEVDVDLELDTAYTANAIGYLEPPAGLESRPLTVQFSVDGDLGDE